MVENIEPLKKIDPRYHGNPGKRVFIWLQIQMNGWADAAEPAIDWRSRPAASPDLSVDASAPASNFANETQAT